MVSSGINDLIRNWRVSNEELKSDHSYLTFHVKVDRDREIRYKNPRNTDWERFDTLLGESVGENSLEITNKTDLDADVD